MKRKEFIKNSCIACAALAVGGSISSILEGCAMLPTEKFKSQSESISISLDKFKESNVVIARIMWLDFDVLAVKKDDGNYGAMYMKCTHQDQPLTATKNGLYCTSHGSTFDLNGNVKKEPALKPLTQLTVKKSNEKIEIFIPKNI